MKLLNMASLTLASVIISGCSTNQLAKTEQSANVVDNLISQDLINVLVQVRALDTEQVILTVPDSTQLSDEFGKALVKNFKKAGYQLHTVHSDTRTRPVSYTVNQSIGAESGAVYTYTVNVGKVSVRRTYRPLSDGWATPVSDAQIRGASATNLIINNDLFNRGKNSNNNDLIAQNTPVRTPETKIPEQTFNQDFALNTPDDLGAVAYPTTDYSVAKTVQASAVVGVRSQPGQDSSGNFFSNSAASSGASSSETSSALQKQNIRNLGESNFASILNAYGTVNETVLIFSNDSTVLGSDNKETVGDFVGQFDPSRDVFSVIGCSHGPTAVSGGQKSLALGRAQRVREALMFAGVPENKILDEGCWDHEQFDERMPRRGVVLALKRKV